ncbi:hypothetical protein [Tenacibaculum sp. 190524A02b]|uniref:hypothetical protein n=1 Tax=Tenacibaculum vairaonense TaxID=3137860 RepID=UPI0031FB677B
MENQLTNQKNFLPGDYRLPDKSKQFMKLEVGDNLIRVLSNPLLGYVFFDEECKPVRRPYANGDFTKEELTEFKAKKNEKGEFEGSKHFWILLVWDYRSNSPKILEVTQISILKPLFSYTQDEDWGDLRKFNININKTGTTKNDTEYSVMPKPHRELEDEIKEVMTTLVENDMIDLEAIWEGKYPFESYNF